MFKILKKHLYKALQNKWLETAIKKHVYYYKLQKITLKMKENRKVLQKISTEFKTLI